MRAPRDSAAPDALLFDMRLVLAALIVLLAAAPAAAEVRTLAEVHTPDRGGRTAFPVVDAMEGHVVWSDYDVSIDAWRLMHHAAGVTRALPVAPRPAPFDVDLGTGRRGGLVAVYSRCARGLDGDVPTPQNRRAARHGCDIYAYTFANGTETRLLRSPADEYWPSLWQARLAFVRGYPSRRDPDGTATPFLYLRDGDGPSRRLRRPSAVITVRHSGPQGRRIERRRLSTTIEGLDMYGHSVAYAWRRIDDFETDSFIYTATAGGALRPAGGGATSGGGAADRVRSVDAPSLRAGRLDWLFTNRGEPEYFGAFVRGGRASPRTKTVAFAADGGTVVFIDAGPAAELEPTAQPGGTFALKADDDVDYRRRPRGWQPIRPPR